MIKLNENVLIAEREILSEAKKKWMCLYKVASTAWGFVSLQKKRKKKKCYQLCLPTVKLIRIIVFFFVLTILDIIIFNIRDH